MITRAPFLWLCGPSGVGKTTVGWEVFRQLAGSPVAFVDADQLGLCYPSPADDRYNHRIKSRNLGAVWAMFRAAGAKSVVMSGGIEVAEQIGVYASQVPEAALTVCRLRAGNATLSGRFLARGWMPDLVNEAVAEADELDRLDFGDLSVDTEGLSVAEVARLVRSRAGGWPASPATAGSVAGEAVAGSVAGESVPVVMLCGVAGVGKSTVGYEVFTRILAEVKAAYVDLAQIGFCHPAPGDDPENHRLKASNLAAMWPAFRDAGASCLVVTGRVNDATAVGTYAEAFPQLTVCRLHVGRNALTERILGRGLGKGFSTAGDELRGLPPARLEEIAERAGREADQLHRDGFGDLCVDTDGRSIAEIAGVIRSRLAV